MTSSLVFLSSEDINRQLPVESKRYQTMERIWRKIMNNAKNNTKVLIGYSILSQLSLYFIPYLFVYLRNFLELFVVSLNLIFEN